MPLPLTSYDTKPLAGRILSLEASGFLCELHIGTRNRKTGDVEDTGLTINCFHLAEPGVRSLYMAIIFLM